MQLSILIPSIPSRWERAQKLYSKILAMCQGKDIEVLLFMDNKKRTVGGKRDSLVQVSRGKYFMFVDDDDDLISVDEIYQATFQDVDVITFKQRCVGYDANKTPFIVTFGLGNNNEENLGPVYGMYLDCKRPPYHVCAWNSRFKSVRFPEKSYGEDWDWVQQCLPMAKTEVFIDKILHSYSYDPKVSEAPGPNSPHPSNTKETVVFPFLHRR
jgi:hypothetical protein